MSREAQIWFRALRIGMSPLEKIVGQELAYRAQIDSHLAWPCLQRLADDTEIPKRTVQRALDSLKERGVLEDTGSKADSGAVIYRMLVKLRIEAIPPVPIVATDQGGQYDHYSDANMATPAMANMASTSFTIVQASHQPSQTSALDRQEHRSMQGKGTDKEFNDTFYPAYPRKKARTAALVAFRRARKQATLDQIMAGLAAFQFNPDPQYVPYPATWLHRGHWQDAPDMLRAAAAVDGDAYGATAWAGELPDGRPDKMPDGTVVMCVGGYDAAGTAVECCQAVGLAPDWRGPLDAIAEWLRAGVTPEAIVEAIRTSGKPRKPEAWAYYAAKVMERRAA